MADHKKFLGRELDENYSRICILHSEKLKELAECGSELLKWDWEKLSGEEELLPPLLFLRNQIEIIESISALIKDGLIQPCNILLRSLFETYAYVLYLFEEDTERRCKAFIVWHLHKELLVFKQADGVSEVFKQTVTKYNNDFFLKGKPFISEKAEGLIDGHLSLLKSNKYQQVNEEYLKLKKEKKRKVNWFSLFGGPEQIESLCDKLEMSQQYNHFYRYFSGYSHGTSILHGVLSKNKKNEIELMQIRKPDIDSLNSITANCFNYAQLFYFKFILVRLPEKTAEFKIMYMRSQEFVKSIIGKND